MRLPRALLYATVLGLLAAGPARLAVGSTSEAEYTATRKKLHAAAVGSRAEYQKLRQSTPRQALEVKGIVTGIITSNGAITVLLRLDDNETIELKAAGPREELRTGARLALIVSGDGPGTPSIQAGIWDLPPAPLAAVPEPAEVAAPERPAALSGRGLDQLSRCQRAISTLNPRLHADQVNLIANNITQFSSYHGVDPYLIVAIIGAESRFNPNARSYKGAMGLGQLMPSTAAGMGVQHPYDPTENLAAAVALIRSHLNKYSGDPNQVALALAAYNAGSGAVRKYGGVPPYRETRNYIWKVYEYYCWMHGLTPEKRR
jgi:hypothetical protein